MAIIACKKCGGELILQDESLARCEYCGTVQTVPKADDEKKLIQFERAERLRKQCEFDKAAGIYESIVADFPHEAEAYWGLVLCKFGIEYVDDPATGEKVPTCHRSGFESVLKDQDFELAQENADLAARRVYREEAKAIEEIRKSIIAVSSNEQPYDIFICYKETDENGDRTLDSVLAQDVYDALTDKGYRVFFSRITLEDKLGQEYEPYIFAALNSAKVMLTFGTDYEYFNAVWVKNEWSRFLKLMAQDKEKHLIPCFKGIDAYDMPEEFARLQAQDMGKVGAIQDLLRGIEKLIPREKAAPAVQPVGSSGPGVESLLRRAQLFLEDRDWKSADEYFDKVLDIAPECAEAYVGKLCAELRYTQLAQLAQDASGKAASSGNLAKALRFGSPQLKKQLEGYLEEARKCKREADRKSTYDSACKSMSTNRNQAAFEATAKVFEALGDYADAREKYQLCMERARQLREQTAAEAAAQRRRQEEEREQDYREAMELLQKAETVADLEAAAAEFDLLRGYRDADRYKQEAQKKAKELLAIQVAEAEKQRQAEQQRKAEEAAAQAAKRKKRLITALIAIPAVLLLAFAGLFVTFKLVEAGDCRRSYQGAVQCYENGEYATAAEMFVSLIRQHDFGNISGIEDSDDRLAECLAEISIGMIDQANFGYLDALENIVKQWGTSDTELLFDIYCDAAEICAEREKYGAALMFLDGIREKRDVAEKSGEYHYKAAEQYLAEGDLINAASNYEAAGDYTDAPEKAKETNYTYGMQKLEAAVYGNAYDTFKALGDYKDSAMLSNYCLVMGKYGQEDLMTAEELLTQLPEDFKNVAELKKQIAVFKPFAGTYECTSYSGGLYEKGVNKNSKVYQKYYYINLVPKLVQLDKNSNELTLVLALECCNERKASQATYYIRQIEKFEKSKFSHKLVLDEDDGKVVEWIDLEFSHGSVGFVSHKDSEHTTYDEVRKHVFKRIEK